METRKRLPLRLRSRTNIGTYRNPKAATRIRLPDDPHIQKVLFFVPANGGSDGGWKLQLVGTLDLPPI